MPPAGERPETWNEAGRPGVERASDGAGWRGSPRACPAEALAGHGGARRTALLCLVLLACAQGSLTVITQAPTARARILAGRDRLPWLPWCTRGRPRVDRTRLAFCARVAGLVIASTHGPGPGEAHLAVLADFHLVIVRLPEGWAAPPLGSRVVAIGPLFRARDGQREVQAFRVQGA